MNDVNDVEELGASVFDSNEALKIVNEGYSRLQEIK